MRRRVAWIIVAAVVALTAAASIVRAQNGLVGGLGSGETAGGLGGAVGFGIVAGTVGSAPAPPNCDGTIDLSTSCVQPMLGGL